MVINYYALALTLRKRNTQASIYIICGQEPYLLNDAAVQIKTNCRLQGVWDESVVHINAPSDWTLALEAANSYSLFADSVLLDVRFDKKTMDASSKKLLKEYVEKPNDRCVMILRIPNVSAKEMQGLSARDNVVLLQIAPLNSQAMQTWIISQLQVHCILHDKEIPALIHQYTQGNMLACVQVIERLSLTQERGVRLTVVDTLEQLYDQCEFQWYELTDACLLGNAEKAIHLLRRAAENRSEPTLVLWLLTQEIRQLSLLAHLLKQSMSINEACNQLKIWTSRTRLYQGALQRLHSQHLYQLLRQCRQIDDNLKTGQGQPVWQAIEQLTLFLCLKPKFVI